MTKFDKNVAIMDLVFKVDNSDWFMNDLRKYLDERFDGWLINIIDNSTAEIFVSGDYDEDGSIVADEMFDITMYIGLELMDYHGIEDDGGDLTELLVDYALEHFLVYPLRELGDEPLQLDDDKLTFSDDFVQ